MKPGETIDHRGAEYYVEKMELRGFGEKVAIWAYLTRHEGEKSKRKLVAQCWVPVSEVEKPVLPDDPTQE